MRSVWVLLALLSPGCDQGSSGLCWAGRQIEDDPACLPDLADRDADTPGVQGACDYVEVSFRDAVPWCGSTTELPCWELRETAGVCADPAHPHFVVIVQESGEVAPYYVHCQFEDCPDP